MAKRLLWVDLEMTGLDPNQDVIIEVAAEITDFDFNTLATYETIVKQPKTIVLKRMQANSWWQDFPENRDQFIANIETGKALAYGRNLAKLQAEYASTAGQSFDKLAQDELNHSKCLSWVFDDF